MYFYPIWIRIWHWINTILCLLLIVTGISMQYSSMEASLIRFDKAVSIHNFCGIALTLSYLIFFIGNLRTENGKHYLLQYKGLWKRISKQFRYYLVGMFRKEQPPFPINEENKFNPLLRISYVLIMYVGLPLLFITGWALLFPEFILDKLFGLSGIFLTAIFHQVLGFLISLFMILHIYLSTLGKKTGSHLMAMISGWIELD